ncbi:Gfo/Idh/MocA family oxidoreductase [Candidatus Saganbacteria bacterium]|nr:Gfo/Idh/MocA family oxidoreductase [Candidatus Saganbacteria bacterium]
MDRSLNVLVVGAGMYVCGRGTDGYGTILPALYQAKKSGLLGEVKVASAGAAGLKELEEKNHLLARMFGFKLNIKCFSDDKTAGTKSYNKAVSKGILPDCAIISIPDHLHYEVASFLMKKKISCLVVKPLAPTLKEVKKLIQIQNENELYCAVEFHKRFDRSNLKLKDILAGGALGDPLYFVVEYSQRKSVPTEKFKSWVRRTNIFQYLGIHYIDIIYFATRAIPQKVMALGQKNFLVSKGVNTYDSIQCIVEWKLPVGNKFTSTIMVNWIDPECTSAMSDQKIKVIGTKGRYEADQKNRGICIVTDEGGVEEPNPDFCGHYGSIGEVNYQGYGIDSILQYFDDICKIKRGFLTVNGLEDTRPTFKQSLIPTKVLESANQSLRSNGKWINLR